MHKVCHKRTIHSRRDSVESPTALLEPPVRQLIRWTNTTIFANFCGPCGRCRLLRHVAQHCVCSLACAHTVGVFVW